MGMKDLIAKARANARIESAGEFISVDQAGVLLVHAFEFYETDAGKWASLKGEIVESRATAQGALVQPKGTAVRNVIRCHGKYVDMGYEQVFKTLNALYSPVDEAEVNQALQACFGSDESGLSSKASEKDRKHPLFAGRGILVGFQSKAAKSNAERVAAGKEPLTNVIFTHIPQTAEQIAAARAKLG